VRSTVRLGTGDTVAFPEAEPAHSEEAVSSQVSAEIATPDQVAAPELLTNPSHLQKLERQEALLADLHRQLEAMRQQGDVERERLSGQLAD
jgi:hypothetical protein